MQGPPMQTLLPSAPCASKVLGPQLSSPATPVETLLPTAHRAFEARALSLQATTQAACLSSTMSALPGNAADV